MEDHVSQGLSNFEREFERKGDKRSCAATKTVERRNAITFSYR